MRCISLWQPWASLMALREKTIETRHWPLPERLIGQRMAIHAAKRFTPDIRAFCFQEPFSTVLEQTGLIKIGATVDQKGFISPAFRSWLPHGALVATTQFIECVPTERCCVVDWLHSGYQVERTAGRVSRVLLSEKEKAFGNYEPGRFAWLSEETEALKEPIQFIGRQGIFEVPDAILSE